MALLAPFWARGAMGGVVAKQNIFSKFVQSAKARLPTMVTQLGIDMQDKLLFANALFAILVTK